MEQLIHKQKEVEMIQSMLHEEQADKENQIQHLKAERDQKTKLLVEHSQREARLHQQLTENEQLLLQSKEEQTRIAA